MVLVEPWVGRTRLLAATLSVTAGGADAVSLLGFGLFSAHITGNLALLGVHAATGRPASVALLLSIPVFAVVVALAQLLADRLAAAGRATLRPLLWAQLLLLAGFLTLGTADPHPAAGTVAVLLAVSAMAVQNALVQLALTGMPATTVMTVNLTRLSLDATALLLRPGPAGAGRARHRAGLTWPVIAGFIAGAALGAACYAAVGRWSAALLVALAVLALLLAPRTAGR